MNQINKLKDKEATIDAHITELVQSRRTIREAIRRAQLAEGVTMCVYDQTAMKTSSWSLFGSSADKTNLVTPGCLVPDAAGSSWLVGSLMVGGPIDVLREWARKVQAEFYVGGRYAMMVPFWMPPDEVLTTAQLRERVAKAETPEAGKGAADGVPEDWVFLSWNANPAVEVAPMQAFNVLLRSYDDPHRGEHAAPIPTGECRVVLLGAMQDPIIARADAARLHGSGRLIDVREWLWFDTVQLKPGKEAIAFTMDNIGNQSRCNAAVPGTLASDVQAEVSEILVGAPDGLDLGQVRATLEVNGEPHPAKLSANIVDTPVGWRFLSLRPMQGIILDPRVAVRVRLSANDDVLVRAVMRVTESRDIL